MALAKGFLEFATGSLQGKQSHFVNNVLTRSQSPWAPWVLGSTRKIITIVKYYAARFRRPNYKLPLVAISLGIHQNYYRLISAV